MIFLSQKINIFTDSTDFYRTVWYYTTYSSSPTPDFSRSTTVDDVGIYHDWSTRVKDTSSSYIVKMERDMSRFSHCTTKHIYFIIIRKIANDMIELKTNLKVIQLR